MSPDAIARAAADRLAPRLGRRFPAAVDRALTTDTPPPPAALDTIAAWLVRAARALDDADRRDPDAAVERHLHTLGRPAGASPAIARAVLAALLDAATEAHAA
ncbi:MAG: hypothetical protein H6701_09050 [Myxococcales bacterium]|nr:hypothetical protein [Myxococcales bacterium]MCB9552202.1 hypothetical protein [Myxococcales bacterium]